MQSSKKLLGIQQDFTVHWELPALTLIQEYGFALPVLLRGPHK